MDRDTFGIGLTVGMFIASVVAIGVVYYNPPEIPHDTPYEITSYTVVDDPRKGHVSFDVLCFTGEEKTYNITEGKLYVTTGEYAGKWVGGMVCE